MPHQCKCSYSDTWIKHEKLIWGKPKIETLYWLVRNLFIVDRNKQASMWKKLMEWRRCPYVHCCTNLFNAVTSSAENSLTAVSTASPSLIASSLLGACSMGISHDIQMVDLLHCNDWERKEREATSMFKGRTGSWRESLNRNHPPCPETLTCIVEWLKLSIK